MNKPLIVIFTAIVLDAVGIGLIFPILPSLLEDVTHSRKRRALYRHHDRALRDHAVHLRAGARLAERPHRPPPGAADFARRRGRSTTSFLAFAPNLWMLLLGRAIAGPDQRQRVGGDRLHHRHFGRRYSAPAASACSMPCSASASSSGPVLGGVLGDYWVRLPFIAAAALNACNLLLAFFVLPESRTPTRREDSTLPRSIRYGRCAGCSR